MRSRVFDLSTGVWWMYGLIRGYAALIESEVSGGQVLWSAMVYSYTVTHNEGGQLSGFPVGLRMDTVSSLIEYDN